MTPEQLQALLDYVDSRMRSAILESKGCTPSYRDLSQAYDAVWETFGMAPPQ